MHPSLLLARLTVNQLQNRLAPRTCTAGTDQSGDWNLSAQTSAVRSVALHDHRDIDRVEQAGLARSFCQADGEHLSAVRTPIQRGEQSEALRLIGDTAGVMKGLVREAAKAEATKRAADSAVCRRLGIEHTERLVVLPQFREACLGQGQAAVLRHFLDRHVAKAAYVHSDLGGRMVQSLCDFVIRLAEVDDVIGVSITPGDGWIAKVPMRDEEPSAILANERMVKVQVTLNQLHFRSRFVAP